jgi:hypothetical protein
MVLSGIWKCSAFHLCNSGPAGVLDCRLKYSICLESVFFVQDLNQKWASLQQLTSERATQLGSAHEVQRFHRDVDETKDWIQEKDEALNNDDLGKDLRSVQALQRKHEGLERDLAALGDKVTKLWLI